MDRPGDEVKKVLFAAIAAFAVIAACAVGAMLVAPEDAPVSPRPGITATTSIPQEPTESPEEPTTRPTEPAGIAGDDLVHVGEDVKAGTYRAVEPVGDLCYWSKSKDAEGSDIIDNGIPAGGRPQVTLKDGQWFTSSGCSDWKRK
jgi:hypothetical protein